MAVVFDPENVVILAGTGGAQLVEEISGIIGIPATACALEQLYEGEERFVRIGTNVRGRDVFVIQSTCAPINDNLIELALSITACKRSAAERVTAVCPYLGYTRMSYKARSRVPVSTADVSSLLEECCLDAMLTVDVRDDQIAGFYGTRVNFESASYLRTAARYLGRHSLRSPVVVAPHASGVQRAMGLVHALTQLGPVQTSDDAAAAAASSSASSASGKGVAAAEAAMRKLHLDRHSDGRGGYSGAAPALAMLLPIESAGRKSLELTGDVVGRDAIIVDDMIDSGTTVSSILSVPKRPSPPYPATSAPPPRLRQPPRHPSHIARS
jgi:phosphoribosylpyrophosphate synthetase